MSALKARRQQLSVLWHWCKASEEVLCCAEITSEHGEFGVKFLRSCSSVSAGWCRTCSKLLAVGRGLLFVFCLFFCE